MHMRKQLAVIILLVLSACAQSGVPYAKAVAALPPLAKDEARVFVYRDSSFGLMVQPTLLFDGVKIGQATPKSFIALRVKAGEHRLSTTTETETAMALNVKPGEEIYVRVSMAMGLLLGRMEFSRVTPEQGREDMQDLLKQERK